jgi:hypothetical protein
MEDGIYTGALNRPMNVSGGGGRNTVDAKHLVSPAESANTQTTLR